MAVVDHKIESDGLIYLIKRLWFHLGPRRRLQFLLLLILTNLVAVAELVSIGAVLPFIAVITSPETIFENPSAQDLISYLNFKSPDELVFPLTLTFTFAALSAGVFRILLLWANTRLAFSSGADIGIMLYRKTLYQPYQSHVAQKSSEVINGIVHRVNVVVYLVILPLLTILSSTILVIGLSLILITVDAMATLAAGACLMIGYTLIVLVTRGRLLRNSRRINDAQSLVLKQIQEGLGGIRNVLINGTQNFHVDLFQKTDRKLRYAQGTNTIISNCPRPVMEAFGMVIIAGLAYALSQKEGGIHAALPVLVALTMGAQRMLPSVQQAYASWASLLSGYSALADLILVLDKDDVGSSEAPVSALRFKEEISFHRVSFRYSSDGPLVLKDVTFKIRKGERVGIIGETGSGKSTLLDILVGLLAPTGGKIFIDGRPLSESEQISWRTTVGIVPQDIYLADNSIAENIALGVPLKDIDMTRVREVSEIAKIDRFVDLLPHGYRSNIGERGIKLSGGQRQRIAIARALYRKADLLVLDEATSSLDNITEQEIISAIRDLDRNLTIVVVAHRLNTLKDCDKIYELCNGEIISQWQYKDLAQ